MWPSQTFQVRTWDRPNIPARFSAEEFLYKALWGWHGPPSSSPDGRELFFTVMEKVNPSMRIYYSKLVNDRWTRPEFASSCQEAGCSNARFSSDGSSVYFIKRGGSGFLCKVHKAGEGWSSPTEVRVPIPQGFTHGWYSSMSNDEGRVAADRRQIPDLDTHESNRGLE